MDGFEEAGRDELVAWVAAWLAQLFEDVLEGECAGLDVAAVDLFQKLGLADDAIDRAVGKFGYLLDERIRLWMDRG